MSESFIYINTLCTRAAKALATSQSGLSFRCSYMYIFVISSKISCLRIIIKIFDGNVFATAAMKLTAKLCFCSQLRNYLRSKLSYSIVDVSVFYDAAHVCLCVRVVFMDNDEILRFQTSSICK